MSSVRSFEAGDVDAVADLFQRLLRKSAQPPSDDLKTYLRTLFIDFPAAEPDLRSRVHVRADGSVSGFLGVLPVEMEFEGRRLKAANCGTFACDDRDGDPFAGARLLRDVLSGPQDLSFTETSNDVSTDMWRTTRATVLGPYSLEWLRVIRPSAFALEAAAGRLSALRLLSPMTRPIDALFCRRGEKQSWSHYAPLAGKADAFVIDAVSDTEFAHLCRQFVRHFPLRPAWETPMLETMLGHATRKALHGERIQHAVKTRSGKAIGLYLYYGDPGGIGRTVQIMAEPGQEAIVIDCLIRNAHARGLVGIRGRTQPALLQAMIGKKCAFLHTSSTIVHSRNPALLEALTSGRAFLNGLAGEGWTRLIGDRFG
ncbi:hypothetical protein KYK30_07455 [Shinella yambaruensis]|uniref:hypothetical protein n=1 Tax=Shinella TaxID=323620 RepID=UPI001FD29160|nr:MULTISPECIES: hypothetical protein [Shinella]MCJ8025068.1 hypothetical protein [Shinella yambaruensis]MCU7979521.1 hypothetical protein [Shinella yambaruensis]MCW5707923.1 hypothetical protein [Shinella sp.]